MSRPGDAEYVLKHVRECHGFHGASSMERLPTEVAINEQTRRFKEIAFGDRVAMRQWCGRSISCIVGCSQHAHLVEARCPVPMSGS